EGPARAPTPTPAPQATPAPPAVPEVRRSESLTVSAVRAEDVVPVTKTDVPLAAIEKENVGQEMPALLSLTPSVTFYADSGGPNGYAYFSIRGVQMTRLNLTFDGAPLNDPEDSAFYFANFGDFAGALGSLQVQRGVGTSTWGAASYGGSVNFESLEPSDGFGVGAGFSGGSFGTWRGSATVQSGLLGGGLKFWVKAAVQETDGFRDNSGVKQGSLFFGLARESPESVFRLTGLLGREKTQMAFLASEKSVLEVNPRDNPLTPEETDSFGQALVQALYTRFLSPASSLTVQAYFGDAGGWYRIRDVPDPSVLYQYGLDWWRAGGIVTFQTRLGSVGLTLGALGSSFESTHTREVVDGPSDYTNHGFKYEANGFAKAGWDAGRWHVYGDAQLRWAEFRYTGGAGEEAVSWTFFNPKLGVRYDLSGGLSAYVSAGITSREPTRSDLLSGEDDASVLPDFTAVRPEKLADVELGLDWKTPAFALHASLYDMEFHDEIALTGQLSETGLPLRQNVPRSWRRGVELDVRWQPLPSLRLGGTLNASRNRISEWTQFYDVYDASGAYAGGVSRTFSDVAPLLTPELVANVFAEWDVLPWITLSANGRYLARSFLDNTNVGDLTTPSLFVLGAGLSIDLTGVLPGRPRLRVLGQNLLNETSLWTSGYSYLYATQGPGGLAFTGIPYYYPQASRSVTVTLDVGF
ncbi:MAG TPA: TonB-dependent receptor, partial [Thermoanaerobaculia bacterium]|nr:TonB-dependent receptor [Thermoanaerobaculia bacterium]